MNLHIRLEEPKDIPGIRDVVTAAFANASFSSHTEQLIVEALRQSGALSFSWIAEDTETIVGHVALSPVLISDGTLGWYGLGPLSVVPSQQGKGIGSQLVHQALHTLRTSKANGCVVLGDPQFYRRFGWVPKDGLILPDVPTEYFQALWLQGALPQGTVHYHEAFSI